MRLIRFTLAISILLAVATQAAEACGYTYYYPRCYFMFRVLESGSETADDPFAYNKGAKDNCREWQRLADGGVPLGDIYQVVYKMPLERFDSLRTAKSYKGGNRFMRWLRADGGDAAEFLHVAKANEVVRGKRNSPWYYPTMRMDVPMTLDEIVDKSMSQSGRLRDRWLLQAMRALFTLGQHDRCVQLWEDEVSSLPQDNLMRRMAAGYAAGSYYRTGRNDEAFKLYAWAGDVWGMFACADEKDKGGFVDELRFVHKYSPNNEYLREELQGYIRNLEPIGDYYWDNTKRDVPDEALQLKSLALQIARDGRVEDQAMWLYAAAFIADLQGNASEASGILARAEKAPASRVVKESVEVMRMYLDAKTMPYDSRYEQHLLAQLRWLDAKVAANLSQRVADKVYNLDSNQSFYYWNDMMRRIVLGEICPRMLDAGKPVRALQLAGMAEFRLVNLLERDGRFTFPAWAGDFRWHNYSNDFFIMADTIELKSLKAYHARLYNPVDAFDTFTNARGKGASYVADIIGTRCLRVMDYATAVQYLGQVSNATKMMLNVEMDRSPFDLGMKRIDGGKDFRLRFAREMLSLQRGMKREADPDTRAKMMVRYATGLRNSFGKCWELTQYYKWLDDTGTDGLHYGYGTFCGGIFWQEGQDKAKALALSDALLRLALATATDDEWKARTLYDFGNFRTVAEEFGDTDAGKRVRSSCDNLVDYHLERDADLHL